MTAQAADRFIASREKLCDGPRCATVFVPKRPGERFCSERCERAAGVTVLQPAEPPCENPTCHKSARPGFKACSIECAEMVAQRRAQVGAAAGPAEIAAALDGDLGRVEPISDAERQRPCATCTKPFKPSKTGWTSRYCSLVCMRVKNPVATTASPAAGPPDPEPDPEPEGSGEPQGGAPVAEPDPPADPPPPPPPPYRDDEERLADARYDGYVEGAAAAMALTWRLLRSDTFRELDQETATAIVVEVLA
jgi:hypothetical protein